MSKKTGKIVETQGIQELTELSKTGGYRTIPSLSKNSQICRKYTHRCRNLPEVVESAWISFPSLSKAIPKLSKSEPAIVESPPITVEDFPVFVETCFCNNLFLRLLQYWRSVYILSFIDSYL